MTTIIIELNKLDADPKNVRKTYACRIDQGQRRSAKPSRTDR